MPDIFCWFCEKPCEDRVELYEHVGEQHWEEMSWLHDKVEDAGLYGNLPTEQNLDLWSKEGRFTKCPHCQGTGEAVEGEKCETCHGVGIITEALLHKIEAESPCLH